MLRHTKLTNLRNQEDSSEVALDWDSSWFLNVAERVSLGRGHTQKGTELQGIAHVSSRWCTMLGREAREAGQSEPRPDTGVC